MTSPVPEQRTVRSKAVWGDKRTLAVIALLVLGLASNVFAERAHAQPGPKARPDRPNAIAEQHHGKLDDELTRRAVSGAALSTTRVIVTLKPGATLPGDFRKYAKRSLDIVNSFTLTLPNGELQHLAARDDVLDVHFDRPLSKANYRTSITTGARAVNRPLGLTGKGIGVAVIDSGIAQWHDDLTNHSGTLYSFGNQRVSAFVDFVNGQLTPYDDEGHGTHVAGIIAGNGTDSNGQKSGIAPDASLVVLKVLDSVGRGTVSNIIAALDWVLANHDQYNIRIVNLSVGAAVSESYWTDPLTLAARRVVDAGVIVVSAAGNRGTNAVGAPQYGAIVAPGNAPWVLTVGASSTNGTIDRSDDTMASFSSRGPTYLDWSAKPDLVAPGVGTVSLSDPWGTFYTTKAIALAAGTIATPFKPYLSLSGTSMSAPVVAGTAALMLQANPSLTPNAVKAILQYTAETRPGYDPLTEGAGFLNALGAVRLAKFYATAHAGDTVPIQQMWSKRINWGNHALTGGVLNPAANAFAVGTTWGAARTVGGTNIVWGTTCADAVCNNIVWGTDALTNIVWGTTCADALCDNIVWGTDTLTNIVWGTDCAGADCNNIVWGTVDANNIVWGTVDAPLNIVWGTDGSAANIVWGTDELGNIVWGTDTVGNIVWGTDDVGNIVWGTDDASNIVWGTDVAGNIVWGTDTAGNIVWGTDDLGNIVWGTSAAGTVTWNSPAQNIEVVKANHLLRLTDAQIFQLLNWKPPAPTSESINPPPSTTTTSSTAPATGTATGTTVNPPPAATTDPSATTSTPTTSTTPPSTTQPTAPPPATSSTTDPTSTTTPTTSTSTTTASPTDPSTTATGSTGTTTTQPASTTPTTPSTTDTTTPPPPTTPTPTPGTTTAAATTTTTTGTTTAPATVDATGTPVPGGSF